jgi:hypothetical protein
MKTRDLLFIGFVGGLVGLIGFNGTNAFAYPENVRHGYVNCTACHVSPTGGGTLTPYGRSLARELMSTWSYKNEEGFLHGLIPEEKMPEWLMVGGDLRAVQTLVDTKAATTAKFIRMGEDIELAAQAKRVTLDLEFGRIEDPMNPRWGSRRYFAMLNITDEVTARIGRFYPEFGLYIPDHYVPTKRMLGFDEGQERNSAEVAWNGETWSAFATASQTPGEFAPSFRETAYAVQLNRNIGDSSKVGVSGWSGRSDSFGRTLIGVHGMIGFSQKLFLLSEFDHQWYDDKATDSVSRGLFAYNRLGYEVYKGLLLFAQGEYGQSDLSSGGTASDAYGPGVQWFPRPHFELMGLWRKTRSRAASSSFDDYGFLMMHYYW